VTDFGKNYGIVKESREFRKLFKSGKSRVTHAFVCYCAPNGLEVNRLGLVASKKVGNAVARNRAKRVIREAFRLREPHLRDKQTVRYDYVFVARAKTPELKSTQIYQLMMDVL
jgi:ribonuclease P protein component